MSTDNNYDHFYQWIQKHGGRIHEHIKIDTKEEEEEEERGLFTTDSIECYTALAVIPWSLVVNNQHPDLSMINTETERQTLIVFLLREYTKEQTSIWFPWIKLLNIDQEAKDFLTRKMNLFTAVEYSTLGQALTARYQQLQEEYEELNQKGIIETSLELFCTIDHLVWSRVLDLPENEPLSLVPLIDFANHSLEANARWFIDDQTHDLILRSERALKPHEEITISYGSKSNEELLYLYGFAFPINSNDRVTLPVNLPPDDILLQEKFQYIQELRLPPRLTLDCHGHLTDESNQLVKILSAQSLDIFNKDHEYCISYLLSLFNDYLSTLNRCVADEKFIKYYLDSQKLIVSKAIENLK